MNNQKTTIILLVSVFMAGILAMSPSIDAHAQMYNFDYGNDH
ncbi:MAG: hypothetical protein ABWY25_05595 [Paenisporosarcina sp.]